MTLRRCSALFPVLVTALAQTQTQTPAPPPDTVIRINVNLVQVDAVVTDSKGRPVTDLTAADFIVLQDGKPQTISNFSFTNVKEGRVLNAVNKNAAKQAVKPAKGVPPPPPPPPMTLKADQIRRTVALVVDDLGLSWESIGRVRQSLKKWVENEMQAGDFVAVVRTGAGMGALQQFTSDKRQLLAAIERVKYNSFGRAGISTFAPLEAVSDTDIDTTAFDEQREQILSVGTMGAINYVVQGLREMPGRKSVVLFSESMRFIFSDGLSDRVNEATRRLVDLANRASVVIYTIDPRGLVTTSLTAADNTHGRTPQQISQVSQQRSQQVFDSQQGMDTLAKETGGLFMHNTNDIDGALRKVVEDGEGYYLLGYHPDAATFEDKNGRPKFHTVAVRLKRRDLHVRSRSGFLGTSDKNVQPVAHTREAQIRQGLTSPFSTGGLHLRLTTLFTQTTAGAVINSLVYFDPRELKFEDQPDDWHKAVIDLVAITFGDNGQPIDSTDKTWTLRVKGSTLADVKKNGMVYSIHVGVKKAGAYQMRVVLRDSSSEQVGSATQFIEVPDVAKGRLTLSGIVLRADNSQAATDAEGQVTAEDPNGTPAVRIFKPGTAIAYGYQILNAQAGTDNKPELEVHTRLFRDGQQMYEGKPLPLATSTLTDPKRMIGGGRMQLGGNIAAGDYVLQVIVTDKLAKEKSRVATQSMDFEVR